MTEHQLAAYQVLLNTADQLRALVSSARSALHPLSLSVETTDAIAAAMNSLHEAQRTMELIK